MCSVIHSCCILGVLLHILFLIEFSLSFRQQNHLLNYSKNCEHVKTCKHRGSTHNICRIQSNLHSLNNESTVGLNLFNRKNKSKNIYLNICNLISVNRKPDPLFLIPILLIHEKSTNLFDHVTNPKSIRDLRRSHFMNKRRFKYGYRACPVRGEFSHQELIISVPLSELKKVEAYDIICSEIFKDYNFPLYVFSLAKGFMYRVYHEYVCPSLKHSIQRCTGVNWDYIKGEGIFRHLSSIEPLYDIEYEKLIGDIAQSTKFTKLGLAGLHDSDGSSIDIATDSFIDANASDNDNPTTLPVPDVESFQIRLARYIKSIKDIVFVYKSIQLLKEILAREPTREELSYAFHGYNGKNNESDNCDIWNEYIVHKREVYNGFHRFLFRHSQCTAENRWNALKHSFLGREYIDECLRKRLHEGWIDMDLDMVVPNIERIIIDSLWKSLTNITILRLNGINGDIVQFVTNYLYHTAYIQIYKSLGVDIQKIEHANTAKRLMDSFSFKRKMMGDDNKDSFTLYNELMQQVSNKMGISVNKILESFDYVNEPIYNPEDPIPRKLRYANPQSYRFYDGIRTFGQLYTSPSNAEGLFNVKNELLVRSMRLLAIEALTDRVARYIFIASNGLFISEPKMTTPEIAKTLGMKEKVIDFINYTSFIRCSIYESIRISKKLPPFIKLYENLERDMHMLELPSDSYYTDMTIAEAKDARMKGTREFIDMPIISQIKYYRVNRRRIVDNLKRSPLVSLLNNVESVESEDFQLYPLDL
ncbi:hypothetical protein BmR1_04g09105 [Babesia microti strain RI]|uniref:Uncharacterized protein n=1 Tax=Babesia microti (strain RI) TaxID=1133968 RepID=I7IHL0_BABMR|nr:hypothetical protein BmR1_04g09105 [Babesia microti strain RI]CCF75997.1 hypothetical protein BmR1_04g09105 [Babesia microti strain RI]|eukprot:XP_012650405.1 hypothetical protein BmR1_04g09105 [Babesia microti strain RI]